MKLIYAKPGLIKIDVEGIESPLYVRPYTIGESLRLQGLEAQNWMFEIVLLCCVDDQGNKVFDSPDDFNELPSELGLVRSHA